MTDLSTLVTDSNELCTEKIAMGPCSKDFILSKYDLYIAAVAVAQSVERPELRSLVESVTLLTWVRIPAAA